MRSQVMFFLAASLVAQPPLETRIKEDLAFLAGPDRQGRGNGSLGLDQAAAFLTKGYESMGLKPQSQRFTFVDRISRTKAKATVGGGAPLVWGQDLDAIGFSADGAFSGKPMLYLGYGLKTMGYDDLEGQDVQGKVALILRTVPDAKAFAMVGRSDRGVLARSIRLQKAGALAVIILENEDRPRPLAREEGPLKLEIPVLSLPIQTLKGACGDLTAIAQQSADTGKPASQEYPTTFSLELSLDRHQAMLPNVATIIPGSDPKLKEEFIVLGAHLDHLGLGERHSLSGEAGRGKVHPGADDNASGTVMVFELAKQLKNRPTRRSVVVLHVSGEEEGLLGSAHWVQNPTVPLPSVKFMLNFDMVGRLDSTKPTLQIGGLGAPKTALAKAKTFAPEGLAIGDDLGVAVGGSDHMSFSAAKIPTFFFFTGVHGDYHRTSDTTDKINVQGMATITTLAEKIVRDLADADQVPAFDPETAKLPTVRGGPVRVAFGSIPDFTENPKGFRINGTSPGSAAEAIGLKAGDVMTTFGGKRIRNLYDFQEVLSSFKPGDKVRVVWLRGETTMEQDAILKGR
ncbi:MAG: M28 family peptidase [Holophaga sp.]|nr:M28 family peptidase [Holophaga sp.]